jgi:phage-related tail fiber protein
MKNVIMLLCLALFTSFSLTAQSTKINTVHISVENEDGILTLNWNTSREVNTSYFVTEKSTDGINYTAMASTKAASSSMFPRSYQAEDRSGCDSVIYYRVVLVLMNGERIASTPAVYRFNNSNNDEQHIAKQ